VFIDELISLAPEDDAEIIEAHDDPLDLLAADELHCHPVPVPANSIEKLILNIDLTLDHHPLASSTQKRCHFTKDPVSVERFILPVNLRVAFKPRPLPLRVAARIPFDLPDRFLSSNLPEEKLNHLFIT
jgi:hypothetical protein